MKKAFLIGAIVMVMIIGGFFLFQGGLTGKMVFDINNKENSDTNEKVKEFNVNAFRFGYSPDIITVNKEDKVRIRIDNTDTLHGIRIPELGIRGNEVVEFTADKKGEFIWYCANMCGEGHGTMKGKLVVK